MLYIEAVLVVQDQYAFDEIPACYAQAAKVLGAISKRNSMAKPKLIIDLKPWSTMELFDLRLAIEQGQVIEMTAALLGREVSEVVRKAEELGLIQSNEQQRSTD